MFICISQYFLGRRIKFARKELIWIGLICCFLHSTAYADQNTPLKKNLRFGVLPDSSRQIIDARFSPLMYYLKQETGIIIELVVSKDYQELLNQFKEKSIDLAYFGGYTFVKAQKESLPI